MGLSEVNNYVAVPYFTSSVVHYWKRQKVHCFTIVGMNLHFVFNLKEEGSLFCRGMAQDVTWIWNSC